LTGVRDDLERFSHAVRSYLHYAQSRFFTPRDYFHLRGQDNQLRYLPAGRLAVCVHPDDSLFEIAARLAAGVITGCQVVLACPVDLDNEAMRFLGGDEGRLLLAQAQVLHATAAELAEMVPRLDRLRYADARRVPAAVYAAAAQHGRYIAREPVFVDGRVELLHYLIGQSICDTYHRHGNLGERGLKRGPA
jgi:RHH-type proline utilization regulon transcriptional repressor/proline dehydrogenase/delta 1-pyrroline-5-carboxylate dehydrogenase